MSELVRGERPALTGWERALRAAAWALAAISLAFLAVYVYAGAANDAEYPFVVNSVAKDFLLIALSVTLARDVRRRIDAVVPLIVAVHLVMPAMLVVTALSDGAGIDHTFNVHALAPSGPALRTGWIAGDMAIVAAFVGLSFMALRSRYGLRFLWPAGYRALIALGEILVPDEREVAPAEVGHRVDDYLARFRSAEKLKIWASLQLLAYWPLLTLHPPYHLMSPEARRAWVRRRFIDPRHDWLVPRPIRDVRRAVIRTAQQFAFMGYYSDPRAARRIGYVPFSELPGSAERIAQARGPRSRVECLRPADLDGTELEADVVIVGTGAAGAMLAYKLAERGRHVLMLERGSHVDPSSFTENEAEQLARLYRDGALTLSQDFRFQVAQGMCVGGSTVVNNAVCLRLPPEVLASWNGEHEAGLDEPRLWRAFDDVEQFLQVRSLAPPASQVNPGGERLAGILKGSDYELHRVDCNIHDCLGCGYCNIGCAYGKKLSALDWTLPRAQREFPGRVRILPDCFVERVALRDGRARDVRARLADGRKLTVTARTAVVLSAGALASSIILQRSGFGGRRAGHGLAFNVASPVTLDFEEPPLHSERGAQISHYYRAANGDAGIALETWFNPVVTQSLFMPGWFERHRANMERYRHMTCLGVVVGSQGNGTVKAGFGRTAVALSYDPTDDDMIKIKRGIELACRIGISLKGVRRVMPSTFHEIEVRSERDLEQLEDRIGDPAELSLSSAHPQGGNPISRNARKGVVDEHFHVWDAPGLYVCDASVFPTSITVNPQLTVMALAAYAADEIYPASTSQAPAAGPGS
jgi:choline dehydrogenase-like flavoprotein